MLQQITERCWFLPCDSSTDRPCLGYVRGERYHLLIDAGNSPAHYHLMMTELNQNALDKPDFLALTHAHWDHTYGLCASECVSFACSATQHELSVMSCWKWNKTAMQNRLETGEDILFCHEHILLEYPNLDEIRVKPADIVFENSLSLDLGGVHAQLFKLPNSHANDCVVIYIPEEKVIFLGDICYEDLHHRPPCWHRARFMQLCDALRGLDFEWAVPGHQKLLCRHDLMEDLENAFSDETPVLD